MWAGIPPVVFPHGGLSSLVEHEKTGLVVHSEQQYVDAIEYLFRNPSQRSRLAENARSFAQTRFRITKHAEQLLQIYQNLVDMPATAKQPTGLGPAERFLASLDESTSSFLQAVTIPSNEAALDESRREQVFYFLMTHGEGGINHYRNCHPEVPQFRLWTALALWNSNRESSIRELEAAEVAGLDVSWLLKTMRS